MRVCSAAEVCRARLALTVVTSLTQVLGNFHQPGFVQVRLLDDFPPPQPPIRTQSALRLVQSQPEGDEDVEDLPKQVLNPSLAQSVYRGESEEMALRRLALVQADGRVDGAGGENPVGVGRSGARGGERKDGEGKMAGGARRNGGEAEDLARPSQD